MAYSARLPASKRTSPRIFVRSSAASASASPAEMAVRESSVRWRSNRSCSFCSLKSCMRIMDILAG